MVCWLNFRFFVIGSSDHGLGHQPRIWASHKACAWQESLHTRRSQAGSKPRQWVDCCQWPVLLLTVARSLNRFPACSSESQFLAACRRRDPGRQSEFYLNLASDCTATFGAACSRSGPRSASRCPRACWRSSRTTGSGCRRSARCCTAGRASSRPRSSIPSI